MWNGWVFFKGVNVWWTLYMHTLGPFAHFRTINPKGGWQQVKGITRSGLSRWVRNINPSEIVQKYRLLSSSHPQIWRHTPPTQSRRRWIMHISIGTPQKNPCFFRWASDWILRVTKTRNMLFNFMRSSSTPKFLLKKIHKFFPNHNNFDGISATFMMHQALLFPNRHLYRVLLKNHRHLVHSAKQVSTESTPWALMGDGSHVVPSPCVRSAQGPMAWPDSVNPTAVGGFHLMETRPEAKKKKIGQRLRAVASRKVLENWKTFVKQTPPQVEFSEKCWKIMSYRHFFIYLPHFASVLGFLLFGFPWVSPTFGDQIALPPTLKTANQHGKHGGKHRPKSEGRVPPRNVEMMI